MKRLEFRGKKVLTSDEVAEALRELQEAGLEPLSVGVPLEERPGRPHPYSHCFHDLPRLELTREEVIELLKRGELEVDAEPGYHEVTCEGLPIIVGKVGEDGKLRVRPPKKYRRLNLW